MTGWDVAFPGIPGIARVLAADAGEALATALQNRGMDFAPPGTTVTRAGSTEIAIPTSFADRIGTTGDAP